MKDLQHPRASLCLAGLIAVSALAISGCDDEAPEDSGRPGGAAQCLGPSPYGEAPAIHCADGMFGSDCSICPGGVGLAQCRGHGTCADGVGGAGTCECSGGYTG